MHSVRRKAPRAIENPALRSFGGMIGRTQKSCQRKTFLQTASAAETQSQSRTVLSQIIDASSRLDVFSYACGTFEW
jgi:hypothetical protein